MELSREDKQEYRRKRNGLGWLFAAGWIVFWYIQPNDGSFFGSASHAGMVLVAIVTSPLGFVASHYVARAMVEEAVKQRIATSEREERLARDREIADAATRRRQLEQQGQRARMEIDRSELIHKLGTVRDYIALLDAGGPPERMLLIRQSIDKELRDLVAKHEPAALAALMKNDEPVRLSLMSLLEGLQINNTLSPDAESLARALHLNRVALSNTHPSAHE